MWQQNSAAPEKLREFLCSITRRRAPCRNNHQVQLTASIPNNFPSLPRKELAKARTSRGSQVMSTGTQVNQIESIQRHKQEHGTLRSNEAFWSPKAHSYSRGMQTELLSFDTRYPTTRYCLSNPPSFYSCYMS